MLPHSHHSPSPLLECLIGSFVPSRIGGELLRPEGGILLRLGAMDRTLVPEAAIDEDDQPLFSECEVWPNDSSRYFPLVGGGASGIKMKPK